MPHMAYTHLVYADHLRPVKAALLAAPAAVLDAAAHTKDDVKIRSLQAAQPRTEKAASLAFSSTNVV